MGKFHTGSSTPKVTDVKANDQNVLLESYIKIIPCRKVTIKRLSKNGKVLSTQQKENNGEAVIMPLSQQEITMGQVEDLYFADNSDLETRSLFSSNKQTFSSRISVKFPFIDNQAHYKRLLEKQKEPRNFRSSSKHVDVDVSIEIAKHLQQLQGKSKTDEDEEISEAEDILNGADVITELPPLPSKVNSEDVKAGEENTNNNALEDVTDEVPVPDSERKDADATKPTKDSVEVKPTRRSSRRATSDRYNLALQSLKPKTSKPEKNKKDPVHENEEKKDDIAKEIDEFTYEVKKDETGMRIQEKPISLEKESPMEMSTDNYSDGSSKIAQPQNLSIDDEIDIVKKMTRDIQDEDSVKKTTGESQGEDSVEEGYICTRSKKHHHKVFPKIKIEEECYLNKKRKVLVKADGTTIMSDVESDVTDLNTNLEKEKDDISPEDIDMEDIFADLDEEESDEEFVLDSDKSKNSAKTKSPFATLDNICKICSAVLAPGGIYKHMKLHKSQKPEEFSCPICFKVLQSEVKLKLHENTHNSQNSDGKFECEKCHKIYSTKSSLFKHRRTGTCATEFECSICFVCFSSERSLEKHNNHFHAEKSLAHLKCKFCNKGFVTRGGFSRHVALKQCHTDMSCHICKKRFSKSASFKLHMSKHQESETNKKTFQCDLCGNFLGSYQSLKKHVSRHLNVRNHACKVCNKKFLDLTEVQVHMRTHSQEKPYMCDICPQRFGQSGHMLRHKLQVHKIGKFPFVCDTCGKGFVDRRNIIMHTKMHEKRAKRQLEKPVRKKKVKVSVDRPELREIKLEPNNPDEPANVIHIDSSYDITELLGAHVTQTNSDGSQTIISTGTNLQSIEHILQAAGEDPGTVEYISTEEIPMAENYGEQHTTNFVNIDGIKVENQMINNENIVYAIEDGGHIESIPASDLGILAETAQQFQNNEEHVTYYIIKKD